MYILFYMARQMEIIQIFYVNIKIHLNRDEKKVRPYYQRLCKMSAAWVKFYACFGQLMCIVAI